MLGRETECEAEAFDCVPGRGSKWRTVKGPKAIDQYELEPSAGGTRVTETVDYDTPPVFGSLIDALFVRPVLIKRIETSLQNLKRNLES